MTAQWVLGGRSYEVAAASDESVRNRIRWVLEDVGPDPRRGNVMETFRDDSRNTVLLTSKIYKDVSHDLTARFTEFATRELLRRVPDLDSTGWLASNIARSLACAGRQILSWQGVEVPVVEADVRGESVYADAGAQRTPFAWLKARFADGSEAGMCTYQDNANFGLLVSDECAYQLDDYVRGHFRVHQELPLVTGRVDSVTVTVEAVGPEASSANYLLSEVVLRVNDHPLMLMAAEAYDLDEWHRYDESVVVLPDAESVDSLGWIPTRGTVK